MQIKYFPEDLSPSKAPARCRNRKFGFLGVPFGDAPGDRAQPPAACGSRHLSALSPPRPRLWGPAITVRVVHLTANRTLSCLSSCKKEAQDLWCTALRHTSPGTRSIQALVHNTRWHLKGEAVTLGPRQVVTPQLGQHRTLSPQHQCHLTRSQERIAPGVLGCATLNGFRALPRTSAWTSHWARWIYSSVLTPGLNLSVCSHPHGVKKIKWDKDCGSFEQTVRRCLRGVEPWKPPCLLLQLLGSWLFSLSL